MRSDGLRKAVAGAAFVALLLTGGCTNDSEDPERPSLEEQDGDAGAEQGPGVPGGGDEDSDE